MKRLHRPICSSLMIFILLFVSKNYFYNDHIIPGLEYGNRNLVGTGNAAIAALVPNTDTDLFDFCLALRSLENLPGPGSEHLSVFVFHEGDLGRAQIEAITECAGDRPISFPRVDFRGSFPEGFDPITEHINAQGVSNAGRHLGRNMWGYTQMIRFWTTRVWTHPSIQAFDTLMRIDTDSCFQKVDWTSVHSDHRDLPSLNKKYVYQSYLSPGMLGSPYYSHDLYDFTQKYIEKEDITPSHPELWDKITLMWNTRHELPVMQTNLEISRREFFQRPDVAKWHAALSETEPFGVFRNRWGDAQTRVLTMALFGTKENVFTSPSPGYYHGRGICKKYYGIKEK